ncbi:MAG: DegT/DnrJ/EryC1/StrS family aminotransferase [Planctomycetaceae bacterium]|nr:DegT/DnrJ/EryC1/StrS family aminotransferase [Planctomycetaceae bacterium]
MIPLCDVTAQFDELCEDITSAIEAVARGGRYILGPNVKAFESEIAEFTGCAHAAGVGSGTDALHLALRAIGIGPGDEVITSPFTFIATTEAILMVGATPVFTDIDPRTFNIDASQIEAKITPQTKAILPVHIYGQPCDMDTIMALAGKHNLHVVEDCAQAIGAKWKGKPVGSFGDAGCFSFFPSKNLGAVGDGGMVTSNSAEVYERVEMLRRHGGRVKYHHEEPGLNSRLDELQAAILRVKFGRLNDWNQQRYTNACRYNELLGLQSGITCPAEISADGYAVATSPDVPSTDLTTVYHQFTVQVDNRDQIQQSLTQAGVGSAVYYPVPLHLQKVHQNLGYSAGSFPVAEQACTSCLSLPMFPHMTDEQIQTSATALIEAVNAAAEGTSRVVRNNAA